MPRRGRRWPRRGRWRGSKTRQRHESRRGAQAGGSQQRRHACRHHFASDAYEAFEHARNFGVAVRARAVNGRVAVAIVLQHSGAVIQELARELEEAATRRCNERCVARVAVRLLEVCAAGQEQAREIEAA